jgi:CelD/BcsL family acetyltransferase involved in cellulose biosynthesis
VVYHRAISQTDSGPVTVRVVDPLALDRDFSAAWDRLAEQASEPNAFAERWCLAPALQLLDADRSARLVAVEAHDTLIGVIALGTARRYGPLPVRHSVGWAHPNHFHGAPLVRAGAELAFWQALLAWCDGDPRRGALLQLRRLTDAGPLHRGLTEALGLRGQAAAVVHRESRAMLHSTLSPDAYWGAAVRPKKRKELRRLESRLIDAGPLEQRHWQAAEPTGPWIDAFLMLEAQGWKGREGSALASHPATEAWARTIITAAADAGRLDMRMLAQNGAPLAMLINFLCPPGGFSFKTAYDEGKARYSPGVLLQQANLALLNRTDIDWVDSCAAPDHPMIDSIWRERRALLWVNIGIGNTADRRRFAMLMRVETLWHRLRGRAPAGADA